MTWQLVCAAEDVSSSLPYAFSCDGKSIAIFKVDDDYYAMHNVCPHAYALLTDGFTEGDTVECALHGAVFHIPTGRCVAPPADTDLDVHPVKLEDNQIYVDL